MNKMTQVLMTTINLIFLITARMHTAHSSLERRSYHQDYNRPRFARHYIESSKINLETTGWKSSSKPMELDWGTVWTLGKDDFTDFHLYLKYYADPSLFSGEDDNNSLNPQMLDLQLSYFWWTGAKNISDEYICFEYYVCHLTTKWKPKIGWESTIKRDYIGINNNGPHNEIPKYEFLTDSYGALEISHSFHGPCNRSFWFNEVYWGSKDKRLHKELKRKKNFVLKDKRIITVPDGIIGFKSYSLPLDVPYTEG